MRLSTRIQLYALFVALLVTDVPMHANKPSYRKRVDEVVQKIKNYAHECKKKLSVIKTRFKARIKKKVPHTEAEAELYITQGWVILCSIIYSIMRLSRDCINLLYGEMPYTENKFDRALRTNDRRAIANYLDKKRVGPNDFCYEDRLLLRAAKSKNLEAVQKLLKMGADPHLPNHGQSVFDCYNNGNEIDEVIHNALLTHIVKPRENASHREIKCVEIIMQKPEVPVELPSEMLETIREYCAGPPYDTRTIPADLREFSEEQDAHTESHHQINDGKEEME